MWQENNIWNTSEAISVKSTCFHMTVHRPTETLAGSLHNVVSWYERSELKQTTVALFSDIIYDKLTFNHIWNALKLENCGVNSTLIVQIQVSDTSVGEPAGKWLLVVDSMQYRLNNEGLYTIVYASVS